MAVDALPKDGPFLADFGRPAPDRPRTRPARARLEHLVAHLMRTPERPMRPIRQPGDALHQILPGPAMHSRTTPGSARRRPADYQPDSRPM